MSFVTTDTAATGGFIVAAATVTAVRSECLLPSDMLASEGEKESLLAHDLPEGVGGCLRSRPPPLEASYTVYTQPPSALCSG